MMKFIRDFLIRFIAIMAFVLIWGRFLEYLEAGGRAGG